jgi:carbamoyltransferase
MNILGVYPVWGHDTCAAIIKDGRLVAAAEEERFTRHKHALPRPHSMTNMIDQSVEPSFHSIKFCLDYAGLTMDDIDAIAVPWNPDLIVKQNFTSGSRLIPELAAKALMLPAGRLWRYKKLFRKGASLKQALYYDFFMEPSLSGYSSLPEIRYYEHHRAHAATAFYASGFENAAVVTADGAGESNATVAWHGKGNTLTKLREKMKDQSIGNFYTLATEYLNMGYGAEGKTMGLSPYGKPNAKIREKLLRRLNPETGDWYEGKLETLNEAEMGFPARTNQAVTSPPYSDLAYEAEEILEAAMVKVAKWTVEATGESKVCVAGGVGLSCTTNSRIINAGFADDIFIFPAANDGGTAIGAALECAAEMGEKVKFKFEHAYWGPEYSDAQIEVALKQSNARFEETTDPGGAAADLIAKGKVIGWFQGRMEIGPRALGNRSILADPTRTDAWEKVNEIKLRERWRPLAPSMLYEAKDEYLENARDSPFMILAFQVPKEKHKEIPAVVHVDGSTRPQTVKKTTNEKYWNLIKKLEQNNGTPVTLNTSFNVGPEPIVCTPKDALRTFFTSQLDAIVIGNYVLEK